MEIGNVIFFLLEKLSEFSNALTVILGDKTGSGGCMMPNIFQLFSSASYLLLKVLGIVKDLLEEFKLFELLLAHRNLSSETNVMFVGVVFQKYWDI